VVWDFFFEANRSRMLAVFNSIMCILILVATLNPLAPVYEGSISCRDAFGFRPKLVNVGNCLVEGFPNRGSDLYNCSGVDPSMLSLNPEAFCGGFMDHTLMGFITSAKAAHALPGGGPSLAPIDPIIFAKGSPTCSLNYQFLDNQEPALLTIATKSFRTSFDILGRPFLLATANSRSNRGYGWGGLAWFVAVLNNIFAISFHTADVRYCGETPGVVGDMSGLQLGGEFGKQTRANYEHKDGLKLNGEPVEPVTPDDIDRAAEKLRPFDTASNWHLYWERPLPYLPQIYQPGPRVPRAEEAWDIKTTMTFACLCQDPELIGDDLLIDEAEAEAEEDAEEKKYADEYVDATTQARIDQQIAGSNDAYRCNRDLFPWLTAHLASCDDTFKNCTFPQFYYTPERAFTSFPPTDHEQLELGVAKLKEGAGLRDMYMCPYGKDVVERALVANGFIPTVFPEVNISTRSGARKSFANVSGWLGHNVPLTFVSSSKIYQSLFSTLTSLKTMTFPLPLHFGDHAGTRIDIPDKTTLQFGKPRSISSALRHEFDPRYIYASSGGGFFWGLNWVNYISLFFELILLTWLAVKFIGRRYHDSLPDMCTQCASTTTGAATRGNTSRRCGCLGSFLETKIQSSFRRRSAQAFDTTHGEAGEMDVFDSETNFVSSNARIKFRVPTRLVSSLVLAFVMVVGSSWRMSKTWIRLEEAAVGMQSQYQSFVKQSGSAWQPLLLSGMQTMRVAANALTTGASVDDIHRWAESEFLSGFTNANNQNASSEMSQAFFAAMTTSQIGTLRSQYNVTAAGIQALVVANMYANAQHCIAQSQSAASGAMQHVLSTTLQQSATAVPAIAAEVMSGVTDIHGVGNDDKTNVTLPDLSTTDLLAMSTENRTALFAKILQQVTVLVVEGARPVGEDAAASCVEAVRSTTEPLATCIVEETLTDYLLTLGVKSPQIPPELTKAMVTGFKSYLDYGSYLGEDFPTRLCEDVQQRISELVEQYIIPRLADPSQVLLGAVETLVSSGASKQLINMIPGIDTQAFIDSLVQKAGDSNSGDVTNNVAALGAATVRTASTPTNRTVPTSNGNKQLGMFIGSVKDMYSWWQTIQGGNSADIYALRMVDWVINQGLTALITAARGGIACTVLATLALFLQMLLFYAHAHNKGTAMHRSIRKYFDPASGSYVAAIMKRKGTRRMTLANVFDIISRDPEPSEVRTLMHLSQWTDANYDQRTSDGEKNTEDSKDGDFRTSKLGGKAGAHQKTPSSNLKTSLLADKLFEDAKKARSVDAVSLRTHMIMSLQYRNLLSAPSFLGTYIFTQVFTFVIYFVLFFIVLVLPIQELFWITVWNFRNAWLSLVILLITKGLIDFKIARRLGMHQGQYSGITHPRSIALFDGFKTILSCMIGWAPAIVRIISSVVATFILLPRLDFKLPGGAFDGSRLKYLGIIETWRLQMEYGAICAYDEDMRFRGGSVDGTVDSAVVKLTGGGKVQDARAAAFASTKATEAAPEVTSLNPARKSALAIAGVN
jgi:hypothetical protein